MDFAKRRLLWSLMRTPEVVQDFQMQKLAQKKLVQENYFSTGSRLWKFRVPLATVGFSNVLAGSLAAKAKPPAAALGYLTTLREPVQEKDSSSDSRLRWVGVSLAAASVVLAVSAARALRSIIDGSLGYKEKLQADTTGDGTTPMQADTTGDGTTPMQADTTGDGTTPQTPTQEKDSSSGSRLWWIVGIPLAAGLVIVMVAVVVVPVLVAAAGFGDGGITAGSLAAKVMSLAAITGHGAWVISGLQSLGAAGLTACKAFLVWSTGTALVSMMINGSANEDKKEKEEEKQKEK